MRKRIILGVVGLTVLISGTYFVCGRVIHKTYYSAVSQLNANREVKINLVSYKSGLFNSHAQIELLLDNGSKHNSKKIILNQKISHGPVVMFNTPAGFKLNVAAAVITTTPEDSNLQGSIKNGSSFNLKTLIHFNRDAHSWLNISASAPDLPPNTLGWETITGELKHDLTFNNYKGSLSIPHLHKIADKTGWSVSDLILYLDAGTQQQSNYRNNILQIKTIAFQNQQQSELKIENFSAKLDVNQDNLRRINLNLVVEVPNAQILDQNFAQEVASMKISNINAINIPKLGLYNSLNLKSMIDIMQQLTSAKETTMQLELPKHFTSAFLSYISYELYRGSMLGKFDKRSAPEIRQDINASVNNLISSMLRQKLFIDDGKFYALNFDGNTNSRSS